MTASVLNSPAKSSELLRLWLPRIGFGLMALVGLYGVTLMYAQGEIAFALVTLCFVACTCWVFLSEKAYVYRYVYPSLVGIGIFIIFPLIYTVSVSFTNFSSNNILPLERVQKFHLDQTYRTGSENFKYKVYQQGDQYQLLLVSQDQQVLSELFLPAEPEQQISASSVSEKPEQKPLSFKEIIKLRQQLKKVSVILPDQQNIKLVSLRAFAPVSPLYRLNPQDQSLISNKTGEILTVNYETGFYQNEAGEQLPPGFTVDVGWENYARVVTDPGIQQPFVKIFIWTVIFSALTVLFTTAVGLLLANLVQWEFLGGNGAFRLLLILPYAVPAFISILVFKGLFNQNFGEINMLLEMLFGIKPEWFSDPLLAKSMVLIVNTWLGYPYMMIVTMGLLKAIPDDLYEASAIDGAGPIDNFFRITLPMIIKPLTPLLIASFAFNFNNFVLIALLTGGGPDMVGTTTPAGSTDLLVSYTYRMAFQNSGQDFGLASAIATIIFIIVGVLAWVNLKSTQKIQAN